MKCLFSVAGCMTFVPWFSNNTSKLNHGMGSVNDCATNRTVGKSEMFFHLDKGKRERERERERYERNV